MMPKYFLSLFIFFLPFLCIAQESDSIAYIRSYPEKFHVELLSRTRATHLQLADGDRRIQFRPNSRPQVGIGGRIVDIGFAIYVRVPESFGRETDTYGKTDYTDLQLNYYKRNFAFTFNYLQYKGFYVKNAGDLNTYPATPHYPLAPDVALEGGSLKGLYIFNSEGLSYRASYNNADRQLVGRGSFLAMTEINHYVLGSDNQLVPETLPGFFANGSNLQGGRFTGFALMPGIIRTFVANAFFLNLTFAAGPDIQYNSLTTGEESGGSWHVAGKINGQAALGFDNDKLYGSIVLVGSRRRFGAEQLVVGIDTGYLVFTIGHRFKELEWMNRLEKTKLYEVVTNPFSSF